MHAEWSPERAERLAHELGVRELGHRHWQVIASAREDAARRGRAPGLRRIGRLTGLPVRELGRLFPGDAEVVIARIADCGPETPGPGSEVALEED